MNMIKNEFLKFYDAFIVANKEKNKNGLIKKDSRNLNVKIDLKNINDYIIPEGYIYDPVDNEVVLWDDSNTVITRFVDNKNIRKKYNKIKKAETKNTKTETEEINKSNEDEIKIVEIKNTKKKGFFSKIKTFFSKKNKVNEDLDKLLDNPYNIYKNSNIENKNVKSKNKTKKTKKTSEKLNKELLNRVKSFSVKVDNLYNEIESLPVNEINEKLDNLIKIDYTSLFNDKDFDLFKDSSEFLDAVTKLNSMKKLVEERKNDEDLNKLVENIKKSLENLIIDAKKLYDMAVENDEVNYDDLEKDFIILKEDYEEYENRLNPETFEIIKNTKIYQELKNYIEKITKILEERKNEKVDEKDSTSQEQTISVEQIDSIDQEKLNKLFNKLENLQNMKGNISIIELYELFSNFNSELNGLSDDLLKKLKGDKEFKNAYKEVTKYIIDRIITLSKDEVLELDNNYKNMSYDAVKNKIREINDALNIVDTLEDSYNINFDSLDIDVTAKNDIINKLSDIEKDNENKLVKISQIEKDIKNIYHIIKDNISNLSHEYNKLSINELNDRLNSIGSQIDSYNENISEYGELTDRNINNFENDSSLEKYYKAYVRACKYLEDMKNSEKKSALANLSILEEEIIEKINALYKSKDEKTSDEIQSELKDIFKKGHLYEEKISNYNIKYKEEYEFFDSLDMKTYEETENKINELEKFIEEKKKTEELEKAKALKKQLQKEKKMLTEDEYNKELLALDKEFKPDELKSEIKTLKDSIAEQQRELRMSKIIAEDTSDKTYSGFSDDELDEIKNELNDKIRKLKKDIKKNEAKLISCIIVLNKYNNESENLFNAYSRYQDKIEAGKTHEQTQKEQRLAKLAKLQKEKENIEFWKNADEKDLSNLQAFSDEAINKFMNSEDEITKAVIKKFINANSHKSLK